MRVALIQHDIVWEDPLANHARLAPRIASAAGSGAELVVLSEMFASGFSMATERIAEGVEGPTVSFLRAQASAHRIHVCGSVALREGGGLPGNELVLAGPDGAIQRYRKIHPFSYAGENDHYAAGDRIATWEIAGVRVTPFVCYDLRFADVFWVAGPATDAYVVVANWPASRQQHWRSLVVARAIENQAYVIAVNRVGAGGGLSYAGGSCVVGPMGAIEADADAAGGSGGSEITILAEIDPARVAAVRAEFPFLADRCTAGGPSDRPN